MYHAAVTLCPEVWTHSSPVVDDARDQPNVWHQPRRAVCADGWMPLLDASDSSILVCMMRKKELLLDEALRLPEGDRADLAAKLIESLDADLDTDVDAAWAREIERRCAAVDAGDAVTSDWEAVRGRIEREAFGR